MEFNELINKINQEIENDCKQIISKVNTYKKTRYLQKKIYLAMRLIK